MISAILQDKQFLQKLRLIALPVALQNLINFSVSAADTIMVGRLGEIQLSAVAVSNKFSFLYMIVSFGVAGGCGVLMAQHWGAGDKQKVREIYAFMLRITLLFSVMFSAAAMLFPRQILQFITTDAAVVSAGVSYLRIMGVGYLLHGFILATIVSLRSTGMVKIAVVVSSASLITNIALNWLLIFGNLRFPAMGVSGAAYATVIARGVEITILAIYLFRVEQNVKIRLRDVFVRPRGIAKSYFTHGSPVLINEAAWALSHFVAGVVIGRMGREFVAANAIAGLLIQMMGIVVLGIASAAGAIIGNTVGEGDNARALDYARKMLILSVFLGFFGFVVIQAVRLPLISLYVLSDASILYARQITHVVSVNILFIAVSMVSLMGTLRGGGDTKFAMMVDITFPWLIGIPLGALAGLRFGWPVYLVYIILRSEDVFKAAVILWRVPRGKWIKNVTKPTDAIGKTHIRSHKSQS